MAKQPNWSTDEIALLKEVYPYFGICDELEDFFPGRNKNAISLKANRLGIHVINNVRKGRTNKEYIELLNSTNFIPLEEYKGATNKILHKCKICGLEWTTRPQNLLRPGAKCPECDLVARKLDIEIVDNILLNKGFERLSPYEGALKPIQLKHNNCGYIWWTKYSYIQQGSGCPRCNIGFGLLPNKNIEKASIYLLKIQCKDEIYYKIGVTVRPIKLRIKEIKSQIQDNKIKITIIHSYEGSGLVITQKEQKILKTYKSDTKLGTSFDGSTEILRSNINIADIINIMEE